MIIRETSFFLGQLTHKCQLFSLFLHKIAYSKLSLIKEILTNILPANYNYAITIYVLIFFTTSMLKLLVFITLHLPACSTVVCRNIY